MELAANRRPPGTPWLFALAFALYAWTAAPSLSWLDSPEFAAAGASLGVAHSPGHPLAGLLGRAASLVPLGDIATRINLLSALLAAAAAAALYRAGFAYLRRVSPAIDSRALAAAAATAALGLAFSWSAWIQAVRAEAYALQSGLLFAALWAVLAFADGHRRALVAAGLLLGLALAHHHLLAILFLVPAAAFALTRPGAARPTAALGAATASAGVVGLAAFCYLPVRAAAGLASGAAVNWGAPATAERFVWTVSAKAFQKTAAADHVSTTGQDLAQILLAVVEQSHPVLLVLVLVGVVIGLRPADARASTVLLVGIAALGAGARAVLGFDPTTPDHHAYVLPAFAALFLLAAAGAVGALAAFDGAWARERGAPLATRAGWLAAAALLLVPVQLRTHAERASLRGAYAAEDLATSELVAAPPRAILLVSYFETSFRLWGLRAVTGARPDVRVYERSFATYPGFEEVARSQGQSDLAEAGFVPGRPTPVDTLAELAARQPVLVELHPNLDRAPYPLLLPAGAFARVSPLAVTDANQRAAERFDRGHRIALGRALADAPAADQDGLRAALLWRDSLRAQFYCDVGRRQAAADALALAWQAAPGDTTLAELARGCGLPVPADNPAPEPPADTPGIPRGFQ